MKSALLSLVVGAVLVTGCGRAVPASPAPLAEQAEFIQRVVQQVKGTAEQRAAGQRRVFEDLQSEVAQCMKERGFTYDAPEFVDLSGTLPRRITLNTSWLKPLDDTFGLGDAAKVWVSQLDARNMGGDSYLKLGHEAKQEYDKGLDACAGPSEHLIEEAAPAASARLLGSLNRIAAEVDREVGDESAAKYVACLADHGYEVSAESDLSAYDQLYEAVYTAYGDYRREALRRGPEADLLWAEANGIETATAEADAACRADAYLEAVRFATPLVEAFAADQAAAIEQVVSDWRALEAAYGGGS